MDSNLIWKPSQRDSSILTDYQFLMWIIMTFNSSFNVCPKLMKLKWNCTNNEDFNILPLQTLNAEQRKIDRSSKSDKFLFQMIFSWKQNGTLKMKIKTYIWWKWNEKDHLNGITIWRKSIEIIEKNKHRFNFIFL